MNAHAHARVGPLVAGLDGTPALDVDALITDPETGGISGVHIMDVIKRLGIAVSEQLV